MRISIEAWLDAMQESEEMSMLEHVKDTINDLLEDSKKSIISCINDQMDIQRKWSDWEWYTIKSFFDDNSGSLLSVGNGYWCGSDEIALTGSIGEYEIEFPWRLTPARVKILERCTDATYHQRDNTAIIYAGDRWVSLTVDADGIIGYLIESLP